MINWTIQISLKWRHIESDGVSNHRRLGCLLNRLFRCRSKKTSKLRVTGLCGGNQLVTGGFPSQRASNAENVSIWWRHHVMTIVSDYFQNERSPLYEMNFHCSCRHKIFCEKFHTVLMKFHTKYLAHTLKDMNFVSQHSSHISRLVTKWIRIYNVNFPSHTTDVYLPQTSNIRRTLVGKKLLITQM